MRRDEIVPDPFTYIVNESGPHVFNMQPFSRDDEQRRAARQKDEHFVRLAVAFDLPHVAPVKKRLPIQQGNLPPWREHQRFVAGLIPP